jgi:hypothetical protein
MEQQIKQVEVKLLQYRFVFRKLVWREEFAVKFPPKANPQRVMLAHALLEVSGIKPKNVEEALRVLDAVPIAIVERVFRIWRGSFPASRRFTSSRLYKAPEPITYAKRVEEIENEESTAHDRMMKAAESKFGSHQLAEVREIEQKILEGAKKRDGGYRGAIPATEDKEPL